MPPIIKRFLKQACVGTGPDGESCYEALAELLGGDTCLVYSITRWETGPDGRFWPHMTDWTFDPPQGWVDNREGA